MIWNQDTYKLIIWVRWKIKINTIWVLYCQATTLLSQKCFLTWNIFTQWVKTRVKLVFSTKMTPNTHMKVIERVNTVVMFMISYSTTVVILTNTSIIKLAHQLEMQTVFFTKFCENGWWWWNMKLLIILVSEYNCETMSKHWLHRSNRITIQSASPNSTSSNFDH